MNQTERFDASLSEESRYRLLVDAITDYAVYMLDPHGVVISWNPGARRFKGYEAEEILGRNFSVFYSEEDRARGAPEAALRTAATEGRFEVEGWRIRKDGARFWAHVVIDPVHSPDGALIGFAEVTRDLTERRATEESLRSSERQFSLLVEGVTDYAIYMLDPQGQVSSWNAGAARIKGYRADEIVGQHFSRFYTEEDRALGAPQQGLDTALREGRFEREGWRVRKDGTRFWAHVVIDTIRDDEGKVAGFAKVTRDITERMTTQKALEEAREALFQSQKLEAIGQLTGGVAHDFNNLLMAILGSLELARKRVSDDPKVLGLIDNAIQGAQRGASLTQRMLAFARRQELRREAVDLGALVDGMQGLLARSISPSISIRTDFPPDLPPAETDPNQLESALLNLVVNARDAMPRGGSITISAQATAHPPADLASGPYLRLTVADTGEGMDPAAASRATEPFFTTKGVGKGTGLGLSMVQGLAQQSGGKLELTSREGQGTSVHLWLPVSARPLAARIETVPAPAPGAVRPLTVLAVDDDDLVLRNTTAMLEDLGHTVLQASSGREALALLRAGATADLMITDQVMPKMTGLQLAAEAMGERPGMKIILATGFAELSPEAGASLPRLAKPFTQDQLRHALADADLPA